MDWNILHPHRYKRYRRHTLYGCVDWNICIKPEGKVAESHTLYGCVDWNYRVQCYLRMVSGHTLYGCVDWNLLEVLPISRLNASHPVWVCGLKPLPFIHSFSPASHTLYGCVDWNRYDEADEHKGRVTPCMGVWIETVFWNYKDKAEIVTPCMGVWIETVTEFISVISKRVTPCMGVWIETTQRKTWRLKNESHPVWVCGLKLIF